MIIEAQDDFKNWLSAILRPMCEADPAALAKYVIALIKKDKSDEELQKTMKEQLLVFLEDDTESFVHQVFDTLKSKEYMTTPVIPNANPPNPNSVKPIKEKEYAKEVKVPVAVTGSTELAAPIVPAPESVNGSKREAEIKRDREFRKNDDKEEKPRHRSRHRSLSRNRSRSRSRSWERARRSRSKEKAREQDGHPREIREKRIRSWRNKSPPRRYDRRRSRSPSPGVRLPRSRSRSPARHRGNRAGGYRRSGSRSRSRSPLLEKRERRDSLKERDGSRPSSPLPPDGTAHADQILGPVGAGVGRTAPSSLQAGKRRCRDYDERGYCMRGEMCPFDHGVDPVVLEDSALTRVLAYNPDEPPVMAPVVPVHPLAGPRPPPPEYNPQAPQMWGPPGRYRGPGPRPLNMHRIPPQMSIFPPGPPSMQRELIPIPVMDNRKPDGGGHGQFLHDVPFNKKKAFDYGRLGPGRPKPGGGPASNCSLELKKVPVGMNSIAHLNNHFSKFGKIVNIRVQCEGDPEAAVVTFSSHAEANAAYRSTEAVLNNRFIKVFWHNYGNNNNSGESKQENIPPQQRSIKDRLGNTVSVNVPPNINKVLNLVQPSPSLDTQVPAVPGEEATLPPAVKEESSKAQEAAAIVKGQELLAAKEKIKKTHEEKKKEMLKVSRDLRKRKQELLEKQLNQQKVLIEKMEKLAAGAQRDALKSTIMKIQESIEAIKRDLEKAAAQAGPKAVPAPPKKKSKEETQKEMLDIELDLISKQQEGVDTSELQRKILELKQRAAGGLRVTRGRKYGPLVSRHLLKKNNLEGLKANPLKVQNKAVLGAFQKHAVDHRPTGLLVSGYEADEQEAVITFFKQFGEIVNQHLDSTLPSVIFKYKTRKEAEVALLKGKHFQDRTLSVTWCNGPPSAVKHSTTGTHVSESDEEHLIGQTLLDGDEELGIEISEEVLLHDDEEEDEENEDRSWRR